MFDIISVVKFISLLTYCGFITSSISGLYEISLVFNLCEMFVSLVVLFFTIAVIYLQLSKEIYKYIKTDKNVFFVTSMYMFIVSFLILGLSDIALGFGILGIIVAIVNALVSIFLTEDNQVENINSNSNSNTV
jgi:hypothetical protein